MHVGLVHILIVIGFPESLAVHFAERLGRLLQSWILTFYSILAPKNGPNFRSKVAQMGGKQQFPYMV